jgi:hypothetical protein
MLFNIEYHDVRSPLQYSRYPTDLFGRGY